MSFIDLDLFFVGMIVILVVLSFVGIIAIVIDDTNKQRSKTKRKENKIESDTK